MKFYIIVVIVGFLLEKAFAARVCPNVYERYRRCSNGCEITCDNYKNRPICDATCLTNKAGCYCDSPYVRSKTLDCVLPQHCSTEPCIRPYEKYERCSNNCELTCKDVDNPRFCTLHCSTIYAGCYCKYPYVRNDNGDCVLKAECKPLAH